MRAIWLNSFSESYEYLCPCNEVKFLKIVKYFELHEYIQSCDLKIFCYIYFSGMLSCVTKEEFVDFTIQIIENSMGIKFNRFGKKTTKKSNKQNFNRTSFHISVIFPVSNKQTNESKEEIN